MTRLISDVYWDSHLHVHVHKACLALLPACTRTELALKMWQKSEPTINGVNVLLQHRPTPLAPHFRQTGVYIDFLLYKHESQLVYNELI